MYIYIHMHLCMLICILFKKMYHRFPHVFSTDLTLRSGNVPPVLNLAHLTGFKNIQGQRDFFQTSTTGDHSWREMVGSQGGWDGGKFHDKAWFLKETSQMKCVGLMCMLFANLNLCRSHTTTTWPFHVWVGSLWRYFVMNEVRQFQFHNLVRFGLQLAEKHACIVMEEEMNETNFCYLFHTFQ